MKISFKVADYSSDRLVIVKAGSAGKHHTIETERVVVRLFDEATIDRLVEVGISQSSDKLLRLVRKNK